MGKVLVILKSRRPYLCRLKIWIPEMKKNNRLIINFYVRGETINKDKLNMGGNSFKI